MLRRGETVLPVGVDGDDSSSDCEVELDVQLGVDGLERSVPKFNITLMRYKFTLRSDIIFRI